MKLIEYYISIRKWDVMGELVNPYDTSKDISGKDHVGKTHTQHPFP